MADQWVCRICNMPFKSQTELDSHNRETHPTAVGGGPIAGQPPRGEAGGLGQKGGEKKK